MNIPASHPKEMRRTFRFLAFFSLTLLASGCVCALHESSAETQLKLRLQSPQPEQLTVRVALEPSVDYQADQSGHVEFTVPRFSHGCDLYVFGVVKTRDGSAEDVRIVEVRRGQRVLRKLSLAEIAKLLTDTEGYRIVGIKD